MRRDARYALRSLRKSPGFTAVAVLSLGLALGLTTTTFAILDAVVNPYVPIVDPERVFWVTQFGDGASGKVTSFEKFSALRDQTHFAHATALIQHRMTVVRVGDEGGDGYVAEVSASFFPLLGLKPAMGRLFGSGSLAEEANGVVLSFDAWRKFFPDRSSLRGASVMINERGYDVIGVLPAAMSGTRTAGDVFTLLAPTDVETGARLSYATPVVRLRPEVSVANAEAELAMLARRMTAEYGSGLRAFEYRLRAARPDPMRLRDFHFAMAGAAIAVLLIACANLANLMLARGVVRRRELALRMAPGATRGALVRQVMVESMLVAVAGAVLGGVLALWGMSIVTHWMPPDVRWVGILTPYLSWRVFAFAFVAAGSTVLLFGLGPALRASDVDVSEPLKDAAGTTTGRASRYSMLVIAEVALSMALLMAAGVMARAARHVDAFDFGYDPSRLVRVHANLRRASLPPGTTVPKTLDHILDRMRQTEGVLSVALGEGMGIDGSLVTSERGGAGRGQMWLRSYLQVSPDYLRTLGVQVLRGRDFLEGDRSSPGVAIVDEDAARQLWPGSDPVDRMIKLGDPRSPKDWLRVVGVARAIREFENDPDLKSEPRIYVVPGTSTGGDHAWPYFVARIDGSMALATVRIRREVTAVLPPKSGGVFVRLWQSGFDSMVQAREFLVSLFVAFGAFALGLAAVGLYGVLAYAVGQRMREFAVRVALGAQRSDVLRLVLHDGLVMVLAGTAAGAFLAMWTARLLRTWLYDVSPMDAWSLVMAEAALFVVSLLACVAPALRATRASPLEILRAT